MSESLVGLGFDVHPRADDGELRLGGVAFPGEPALVGHSDGDVVCHAVADALLGAAGLGDLGELLPDTDPSLAGIAGDDVLARTLGALSDAGRSASSLDITVVCDRPAISPRRQEIREHLAAIVGLPVERVSVKATRPEGLGLTGDGVACLVLTVLR
ncbi:MAG TPA: 2-C-methyl-D-erythritol 2,4-cyclodiphosphate synthase [Actinomycetota bacterium]|nr:2-C-methyl-D-erythritol 2,4-cyclodiphosphate synthase [Actinomycetota bacterium]